MNIKSLFYCKERHSFTKLFDWLFTISLIFMTLLLSSKGHIIFILISLLISVCFCYYFCIVKKYMHKFFSFFDRNLLIFSIIISVVAEWQFLPPFYNAYNSLLHVVFEKINIPQYTNIFSIILSVVVATCSFFAIVCLFYLAYTKLFCITKNFFKTIDTYEKWFLFIGCILFAAFIIVIYSLTYVFYGKTNGFDIIYTSDSWELYTSNCWLKVSASQNDFRQPLFAVCAAPFSVIPYAISLILFFIPNIYAILIAIEQVIILFVTFILIIKLLNLDGLTKLFALLLFTCSFPALLFSLNLEQYIFSVFWLIVFIYAKVNCYSSSKCLYIASTGTLLTNGIMLPILYTKNLSFKSNIKVLCNSLIVFLLICFVFGKGHCFINIFNNISDITRFTGKGVGLIDKIKQYSTFVFSCFCFPMSIITPNSEGELSIQLSPNLQINYLGITILFICIISFILNHKNKFALISFFWICFSFIILVIVGWGSKENGMILYSLYFNWAYFALIILLINKIPNKLQLIKYIIYCLTILLLLYINIKGICFIIKFGITYYPLGV